MVCFGVVVSLFYDQSVCSSYQPMTYLAYLHDCHSCHNERSIDQKKSDRAATCPHEKTRRALGNGISCLATYDARTSCIPLKCSQDAMLLREDWGDSQWHQPWTPDSFTHVTDMSDQKSPHRVCNRHISMGGLFLLLVGLNQQHLLSLASGCTTCCRGIK